MSIPTLEEIRKAYNEITIIMMNISSVEQCKELSKRLGFTMEINGFSLTEYENQYKTLAEADASIDWIRVEDYEMLSYVYFHKNGPVMFDVWCDEVDDDFLVDITIDKLEAAYADGVKWIEEHKVNEPNDYRYSLLARLKMDCDYYLGASEGYEGHLWAKTVESQIEEMKNLYNGFSDDKKPEWISMEDILDYEAKMTALKAQKNAGTHFGIRPVSEDHFMYSQGFRYVAYETNALEDTGLMENKEYFRTMDDVLQFLTKNPEYINEINEPELLKRRAGRSR